jgi:cysteine synthase A
LKNHNENRIKWDANKRVSDDLLQLIGRTPLVKLKKIAEEARIQPGLFGKLEYFNPSGSLKDRIYYEMITGGINAGDLKHGMKIIEASSGNAGIACSFIGQILGFEVTIVMPRGMSEERVKMIQAFGGNVIFTKGGESDIDLGIKKVKDLVQKNPERYWWPDQFSNLNNPNTHYKTTGPEIWQQTIGTVDCFLASVGTGGTLSGVGRFLKENNPNVSIYAVEPAEAPTLSKREWGTHKIEGIGDGFAPQNLDLSILTGIITTTSKEAIETSKKLALIEGIFCGISSGCNVAAAIKIANKHPQFRTIVTMINDSGQRYFSTELCGEERTMDIPIRDHPLDPYTETQLDKYQANWEIVE